MNKCAILFLTLMSATLLPAQTAREIEAVLAKISTFQYGADPAPSVQLDEMIGRMSGSPEMRRTAEGLLLKFLQSNATPAGKESAFRQLSLVGSNASIPVLAPMLTQIDTAEMARFALAAIPGPAVDEALRTALSKAPSDRVRIGIINSMAHRRDARAVTAVSALVPHTNPEVSAAAIAALANIADRAALDALAAARKSPSTRALASEAYVVCADHFAARGETQVAVKVYQEMIAPGEAVPIRTRALKSFARADSKAALPALVTELQSTDTARQLLAIQLMKGIQGPDVTKALMAAYPKVPPVTQVHILTAAAGRADAAARPIVLEAVKSRETAVRSAALSSLGRVGNASDVPLLAQTAASADEPERSAARQSLYTMRGADADKAVIAALGTSTGKVKSELILAVGERATAGGSDALARAAQDSDPDVRREAMRALRNVGSAAQAPALLAMLLKATSAIERRDLTQTLATVVRRANPVPIAPVITAYNAAPSKEARMSLLDVMGQTSSADALPVLRAAVKDPDPEIARASILALTAWDNATPLPDLLSLARTAPKPSAADAAPLPQPGAGRGGGGGGRGGGPPTNNVQVLALRGVLRLVVLQSQRSAAESGKILAEVMSLATLLPEKRNVLSLLSYFPSKESLGVAQAAMRDPGVADEAKVALDQVTEALKAK